MLGGACRHHAALHRSAGDNEERQRRGRLLDAVAKAVDWYHERLLAAPTPGRHATTCATRGFDGDVVRRFRSGGRPTTGMRWPRALQRCPTMSASTPGSATSTAASGCRPTRSGAGCCSRSSTTNGEPVAFGGRMMPGARRPEVQELARDADLLEESQVLYGLNWAKADDRRAGRGHRVRGLHRRDRLPPAGVPRAVATCGTALTEEHVRLMKSFARRVVLAFDADAAGQAAAERFYEWEQQLRGRRWRWPRSPPAATRPTWPAAIPRRCATRSTKRRAVPRASASTVCWRSDRLEHARGQGARSAEQAMEVVNEHPNVDRAQAQYAGQVAHAMPDYPLATSCGSRNDGAQACA